MRKLLFLICFIPVWSFANDPANKMTKEQYIEAYSRWAIWEMYEYGIPASITLAQGLLESSWGNSPLAREANNHFGIKCHTTWNGLKYYMDDDSAQECFRVYPTVLESYRDHSLFLRTRPRYASLFELEKQDFIAWAKGLKAAGYATNPKYAEILIKSIEENELFRFDNYPDPRPLAKNIPVSVNNADTAATQKAVAVNEIQIINGRKCVKVNQGFKVAELSLKYDVSIEKLYKYNDITSEEMLDTGMYFYIEKKQNEAQVPFHITTAGQSMFWIAQYYGIKLSKLYDFNRMERYMQPAVGEKVYLQEERADSPKVRTFYEVIVERNKMIEAEKQLEIKRRAQADKAVAEERYRLQIEELKKKNKEDEIKIADMAYRMLKMKEEQVKFLKNKEERRKEIERLEKQTQEKETNSITDSTATAAPEGKSDGSNYTAATRQDPKTGNIYHIVGKGETLYSISKKYNTTIDKIKTWNSMTDNSISLGQEILIEKER